MRHEEKTEKRASRATSRGDMVVQGSSNQSQNTFLNDAMKAWNKAPPSIRNCNSLHTLKKEVKKYVSNLPI